MVFLKYKLDLLKNGNKSYLYDVLDDDLIEKIIKMVNKPNILIIDNLILYNLYYDNNRYRWRYTRYNNSI